MSTNRFWRWFENQIAQQVPEDCAACAFDCKKTECSSEHWATCERRLQQGIPKGRPLVAAASVPCGPSAGHV
jgi:hypothetical protein